MNQLEKTAELIKIAELEKQIEEMKQLISLDGFLKMHYKNLSNGLSKQESFENINQKHFNYYGVFKYSDYSSFKVVVTRYYK